MGYTFGKGFKSISKDSWEILHTGGFILTSPSQFPVPLQFQRF